MKKLFVPLLLTIATIGSASAKWTLLGNSAEFDSYIDYATVRTNGQYREAWFMTDYKGATKQFAGFSFMSTKNKTRFDCKQEKTLNLSILAYTEPMGNGNIVETDDTGKWIHIVPGSDGAIKYDVVCRNKR